MKKNKEINFAHGIMFHHFHDDKKHKKAKDHYQLLLSKK